MISSMINYVKNGLITQKEFNLRSKLKDKIVSWITMKMMVGDDYEYKIIEEKNRLIIERVYISGYYASKSVKPEKFLSLSFSPIILIEIELNDKYEGSLDDIGYISIDKKREIQLKNIEYQDKMDAYYRKNNYSEKMPLIFAIKYLDLGKKFPFTSTSDAQHFVENALITEDIG